VLVEAWDFAPGSHWISRMREGLARAERMLSIVSADYLKSVYGQVEWEAAYRSDPHGSARRLIPVRVQDCELPDLLGGVVPVDLFDCLTADDARRRLRGGGHPGACGEGQAVDTARFPRSGGHGPASKAMAGKRLYEDHPDTLDAVENLAATLRT
jgi:hypothetical protein